MHRGTSKWGETTLKLWLFFLKLWLVYASKDFFSCFFNQSFPYQFFFILDKRHKLTNLKKEMQFFFAFICETVILKLRNGIIRI